MLVCAYKCKMYDCIKLFLVTIFLGSGYSITRETNNIAEVLWNLTRAAVQSRQVSNQAIPYRPDYFTKYPQIPPNINRYPQNNLPNVQSFMEALNSIASNDDLRCVTKLVCEVTAGTITGSRQSSFLPFNVDYDSLINLLSNLEGLRPSPLIMYGKAAALGYTSKGNSASCTYAYPRCPSNPDVLIEYLNNHRGGFFRFFNGAKRPQTFNSNPHKYEQFNRYQQAEKRILNKPNSLFDAGEDFFKAGVRFPIEIDDLQPQYDLDPYGKLNFAFDYSKGESSDDVYRRPKTFSFPEDNNSNYGGVLNFERPLPNHRAPDMIFPDRTGTGEFIVDTEIL